MQEATTASQEAKVLDIFSRHLAAFVAGNLEGVLEDFGPDSVVVTQDGVFAGLDRIRLVFGALLAEFGNISSGDSPGFTFDVKQVSGDTLFITWHAESKHHVFPFGTDTFVCNGDKIIRQSIAMSPPLPR